MKNKSLVFILIFMAFAGFSFAAFDKGGVLGVGARALGMGDAFGAVADDGSAVYWNVAGLTQLERAEVNLFVGPLLNGKEYYIFTSFGSPFFEDTAWQLSLISLIHSDKNQTKELVVIGSFASALNIEKTFSVGVNVKYLNYNSIASYTSSTGQNILGMASGLGLDLGVLYQIPLPNFGKKLNFGLFIQDIDTSIVWQGGSQDDKIPTLFKLASAYYLEETILITADVDFFSDLNISGQPLPTTLFDSSGKAVTSLPPVESRLHIGVEGWFFKKHLGLRGGYTGFATTQGRFTGGASYRENTWEVDYAYIGHAEHLGDSHRFSIALRFGPERERVRAISVVAPPKDMKAFPANNAVNLTWEPNTDPNVTGYAVYMSKSPGARYIPVAKRIKENYVTIDGIKNGTRYYFVITTINNTYPSVESDYSNETSAVPAPVIPGTPELFAVGQKKQVEKNGVVDVRWGAIPPTNIAGYNIYISESSGKDYNKTNPAPVKDSHYVISGLEVGKKYFFVLTSVTNDVPPIESKFSREWSDIAKPGSAVEQISAPAGK
ncbi:MAG: PorV/PorQ family protein [bacterium]